VRKKQNSAGLLSLTEAWTRRTAVIMSQMITTTKKAAKR